MLVALLLGIVQGLTEFIPVSSSGHLVLGAAVLGVAGRGLAVDVALHVGTLAAVVVVFREEIAGMVRAVLSRRPDPVMRRLAWLLVAATVPIVIVGLLARDAVEGLSDSPRAASAFLLLTAALLLTGEAARRRRVRRATPGRVAADGQHHATGALPEDVPESAEEAQAATDASDPYGLPLERLGLRQAGVVGVAQCLALLPGVSRSGATISAGMAAGMTRTAATRFSFLLSLPAMAGAAVLTLPDLAETGGLPMSEVIAGTIAAFVAGYAAIRLLLALVARAGLQAFAIYCIVVAVIGLAVTA